MGENINLKQDRNRLVSAIKLELENDCRFSRQDNPSLYDKLIAPIVNNLNKDYPAIDKNGVFSYAKSEDDPANSKNRITTTLGRYIRRVLKIDQAELADYSLTNFTDSVLVSIKEPDVKILKGNKITEFYRNTKISSCMTNECAYYTELYALNPKNVFLAVLREKKEIVARAILWKTDDGKYCLDRVYAKNNGTYELALKTWALKHGYILIHDECGYGSNKDVKITLKAKTYIPYLDSFEGYTYFSSKKKKLILATIPKKDIPNGYGTFHSTGAGDIVPWIKTTMCKFCGDDYAIKNNKHRYFMFNHNSDTFSYQYICEACSSCFKNKTCPICKKKFVYCPDDEYLFAKNKPMCGKCTMKRGFYCHGCQLMFDKKKNEKHIRKDYCNRKVFYCKKCVVNIY